VDEALGLLEQVDFSLVLCDITMPGKSGLDFLETSMQRFPDTAVIMVTALNDRETAIQTLELGAYGYIIKPFHQNEVVINVASALERRRLAQEAQKQERWLEGEVRERTAEVRHREEEIALRLVSASEYRDEETGAHIRRIGLYVSVFANALGWTDEEAADIRVAGPMHDIGKIGVADTILLKPGRLTDEEFEAVKQHTLIGADILAGTDVALLHLARDIALGHHEKWDGSGYPRGLAGEAIPAAARLVAITDVYDALVHKRVYRDALPEDEALSIMGKDRGTHFDPGMFDCFLDLVPEFRRIREEVTDLQVGSKLSAGSAKPE